MRILYRNSVNNLSRGDIMMENKKLSKNTFNLLLALSLFFIDGILLALLIYINL